MIKIFSLPRALALAAAAVLAVSRPEAAGAQARCRSDVPRDEDAYAYRLRGDRCEGRCGRLASTTTALRVVGFSRGTLFPAAQTPPRLTVQWSAPDGPGATLRVSAVAGPFCYQMDADAPTAASAFAWSSHILRALEVRPAQLAALVRTSAQVNGRREEMIVPAEPGDARTPGQPFMLYLVPGRAFDRITFGIRRASDGAVIVPEQRLVEAWFPANQVVRFRLPPDLPAEVPLRLHIVGEYDDQTNSTDELLWIPR
ncbi:MAG TPA: hypothetical protein VF006_08550 [Longimicrobium sp.]